MSDLSPGFADPVTDAQRCFRAVLDAMAQPGQLRQAPPIDAPPPLCAATAAVLLTLVDGETPLWIDQPMVPTRRWIEFHCGAPVTTDRSTAMFGLAASLPDLASFEQGTHEQPETAATLILQVPALGHGAPWKLSGPGIETTTTLQVDGLPVDFVRRWQANRAQFPRGVDLILCAGNSLAALPRSITVEEL